MSRRMPVRRPRQVLNLLQRPPSTDLRADISLARAVLLLPTHYSRSIWQLAPAGAEGGVINLWADDEHSGLTLPTNELAVVRLDREWRTATMLTPGVVIPGLDDEALAAGAWAVLTQVDPRSLVRLAVSFALRRDVFGSEMDPAVVAAMNFQGPLGDRLAGLTRGGAPIWHAPCDCARGRRRHGQWRLASSRPARPAEDARPRRGGPDLLPDPGHGVAPSPSEIWRAMWALHQGYRFGDDTRDPERSAHESLLSLVTSAVYSQPKPGSWLPQIERWERIYRTDDTDASVQRLRPKPSQIDLAFRAVAGISVQEWLVANWFLASRFFVLAHTHFGELDRPLEWLFAGGLDESLDPCYAVAVKKLAVSNFTEFGHDVLAENPAYDGLGSTVTSDVMKERLAEPVKRIETLSYDAFCATSSAVTGSLIQAMVGSFGGSGRRWRNRAGLAA